mmetsp:Transcript_23534/g.65470  ORF Transcript_23534/g.65470 Transcript_23534/m.65470 type:complete len:1085 (+) Transcript_23534:157-3411(+)
MATLEASLLSSAGGALFSPEMWGSSNSNDGSSTGSCTNPANNVVHDKNETQENEEEAPSTAVTIAQFCCFGRTGGANNSVSVDQFCGAYTTINQQQQRVSDEEMIVFLKHGQEIELVHSKSGSLMDFETNSHTTAASNHENDQSFETATDEENTLPTNHENDQSFESTAREVNIIEDCQLLGEKELRSHQDVVEEGGHLLPTLLVQEDEMSADNHSMHDDDVDLPELDKTAHGKGGQELPSDSQVSDVSLQNEGQTKNALSEPKGLPDNAGVGEGSCILVIHTTPDRSKSHCSRPGEWLCTSDDMMNLLLGQSPDRLRLLQNDTSMKRRASQGEDLLSSTSSQRTVRTYRQVDRDAAFDLRTVKSDPLPRSYVDGEADYFLGPERCSPATVQEGRRAPTLEKENGHCSLSSDDNEPKEELKSPVCNNANPVPFVPSVVETADSSSVSTIDSDHENQEQEQTQSENLPVVETVDSTSVSTSMANEEEGAKNQKQILRCNDAKQIQFLPLVETVDSASVISGSINEVDNRYTTNDTQSTIETTDQERIIPEEIEYANIEKSSIGHTEPHAQMVNFEKPEISKSDTSIVMKEEPSHATDRQDSGEGLNGNSNSEGEEGTVAGVFDVLVSENSSSSGVSASPVNEQTSLWLSNEGLEDSTDLHQKNPQSRIQVGETTFGIERDVSPVIAREAFDSKNTDKAGDLNSLASDGSSMVHNTNSLSLIKLSIDLCQDKENTVNQQPWPTSTQPYFSRTQPDYSLSEFDPIPPTIILNEQGQQCIKGDVGSSPFALREKGSLMGSDTFDDDEEKDMVEHSKIPDISHAIPLVRSSNSIGDSGVKKSEREVTIPSATDSGDKLELENATNKNALALRVLTSVTGNEVRDEFNSSPRSQERLSDVSTEYNGEVGVILSIPFEANCEGEATQVEIVSTSPRLQRIKNTATIKQVFKGRTPRHKVRPKTYQFHSKVTSVRLQNNNGKFLWPVHTRRGSSAKQQSFQAEPICTHEATGMSCHDPSSVFSEDPGHEYMCYPLCSDPTPLIEPGTDSIGDDFRQHYVLNSITEEDTLDLVSSIGSAPTLSQDMSSVKTVE